MASLVTDSRKFNLYQDISENLFPNYHSNRTLS